MKIRTETEQKEFKKKVENDRRMADLYYPDESQVIREQPGDFVYYHALDAERQAFVVRNANLDVDLVMRVSTDDWLLTRAEFEALFESED
ncbi:MAG: hypothetical protein WC262_08040 [Bacteroidales bacterium]|jgi:phage pi2 protein 07